MPRLCRALLLLGVLISASTAFAQSGLGSITGTLLDTTGGRLPGAEVKVVETSTGATRTTISNEAGLFNLAWYPYFNQDGSEKDLATLFRKHIEHPNEMGENNRGETHVRIAKHRNGSLETIKLRALLHIQKFVEDDGGDFGPVGLPGNWKPVKDDEGPKLYIQTGSKMNDANDDEDPF